MGLSKFILTLLTREQIVSTSVNADVNDEESTTDNSTSSHSSSTVPTSWTLTVDENFWLHVRASRVLSPSLVTSPLMLILKLDSDLTLSKFLTKQVATPSVTLPWILKLTQETLEAIRSLHKSLAPVQLNSPHIFTVSEWSFNTPSFSSSRRGRRQATCEVFIVLTTSGSIVRDRDDFLAT